MSDGQVPGSDLLEGHREVKAMGPKSIYLEMPKLVNPKH
jgi:hypothetical protein